MNSVYAMPNKTESDILFRRIRKNQFYKVTLEKELDAEGNPVFYARAYAYSRDYEDGFECFEFKSFDCKTAKENYAFLCKLIFEDDVSKLEVEKCQI